MRVCGFCGEPRRSTCRHGAAGDRTALGDQIRGKSWSCQSGTGEDDLIKKATTKQLGTKESFMRLHGMPSVMRGLRPVSPFRDAFNKTGRRHSAHRAGLWKRGGRQERHILSTPHRPFHRDTQSHQVGNQGGPSGDVSARCPWSNCARAGQWWTGTLHVRLPVPAQEVERHQASAQGGLVPGEHCTTDGRQST